jgi:hypothetical protein
MPLVWPRGVLFRSATGGITQERGERGDSGRVLNALRETLLGPGAPRIVRAGLPDRGALLVAEPDGQRYRACRAVDSPYNDLLQHGHTAHGTHRRCAR